MTKRELCKQCWAAAAVLGGLALSVQAQTGDTAGANTDPPGFEGFDFGHVVTTMEASVNPLQREMDHSFQVFVESIEEAEQLLDAGQTQEAVDKAAAALDVVLAVRETVLTPMWEGQQVLAEQIAGVRMRLARAVEATGSGGAAALDAQAEATLDAIAKRVAAAEDPLRKKRLVAHYRTVRNLARIRALAVQLSPDQRRIWSSVLQVLSEAALAHQQVMMGSEVLFAQFEATSSNLKAYVSLMDTVDGASRLIGMVRGAETSSAGMAGFADSMMELQQRLSGFNESVESALQARLLDLDVELDLVEPFSGGLVTGGSFGAADDAELLARIDRVSSDVALQPQGDR